MFISDDYIHSMVCSVVRGGNEVRDADKRTDALGEPERNAGYDEPHIPGRSDSRHKKFVLRICVLV